MPPIRTVLIDDEPPARERLSTLLRTHPQVEIIGEAFDVESSAELCERERPDLLFLDIQLPRGSGFDLLPRLSYDPSIIFVTASNTHAVKAFEVNALDYLLKPIHPDRLALALARLDRPAKKQEAQKLIALDDNRGLRFVEVASISCIKSDGNYTTVYLTDGPSGFVRRTLGEWEKILPQGQFLRVDRSLLIRLDAAQEFHVESRDSASLILHGCKTPIILGRRAALKVRMAMRQHMKGHVEI
jgi:two-component system LytT family response regulator